MRHVSLEHRDHRPWPLPDRPWVIAQSWRHLLFAHWRVPAERLRPLVPAELELEEAEGSAWLGVVPFQLLVRPRLLPALPRLSIFPEINVRTYVRHSDRPGVWFLSLDARSRLAVRAARRFFHLPYHHARMHLVASDERVEYASVREGAARAAFRGRYGPSGPAASAAPGTLEHFLTERYCLYARSPAGRLYRCEVHHAPWPLQTAWAEIEANSMAEPAGIELPTAPDLLHFASRLEVTTWLPRALSTGTRGVAV
jgi:hypothetical protein